MNKKRIEELLLDDLQAALPGDWKREVQPTKSRRWKIDIASEKLKVSIEVEGARHLTAKQHRSDCEKQNYLESRGWTCFRYPASSVKANLRRGRIVEQIVRATCGVPNDTLDSHVLQG